MPLSPEQITLLETKFVESGIVPALPDDWKQQALALTLSAADNRAMATVLDALTTYKPLPDVMKDNNWESFLPANDLEFRGREVIVPLLHFIQIRERTREILLAALEVEDAIDDETDRDNLVAMVVNDVAVHKYTNDLLLAKSKKQIETAMRGLLDAAGAVYEAVEGIYDPARDQPVYEPAISESGEIMLLKRSTVKITPVSRGGSPPPRLPEPVVVKKKHENLSRQLMRYIWQLLTGVVSISISFNIEIIVQKWIQDWKSGEHVVWLQLNYAQIKVRGEPRGFLGYQTQRDVPDLARWIGEYGTGMYGITDPNAPSGYVIREAILFDVYKYTYQQLTGVSAQLAVRAVGTDNSLMTMVLMAVIIRALVMSILSTTKEVLKQVGGFVMARIAGRR
jgi:hypothetical protein